MFAAVQTLLVALIVVASAVYALWALIPSGVRRQLAIAALRWPLPAFLLARLRHPAQPAIGCACDGCDHATPRPAAGSTQRVTFHPRLRR
jgi:hypothetical protein